MNDSEQWLLYALALVTLLGSLTVFVWQYWRQYGPGRRRRDDDTSDD